MFFWKEIKIEIDNLNIELKKKEQVINFKNTTRGEISKINTLRRKINSKRLELLRKTLPLFK